MMSKKQLTCMLALHIMYLLVGASIFVHIESPLEVKQRQLDREERTEIQNLLYKNYVPSDDVGQDSIIRKLSDYCGKPFFNDTTEDNEPPYRWDFYHSFFFSYTVVSTIGYGNLAPTTHLGRILMIFYGLFGIPINGILLANLGEYFGMQLISVYRKYKKRNEKRAHNLGYHFTNLGMLGQIFLYLVPGFLFFIFLPACIFVVFEGWDYVASIYYAFVTLTTIGFGDLVAGTVNNGFKYGYFCAYQIFLIVWITFGLGYIVMLLGFITSGMRSERIHRIEQKFACQIKNTQNRILQGFTKDLSALRKIINEANLIKIKPVYVESFPTIPRSKSCPIFTYDVEPRFPVYKRKRANSENIQITAKDMLRIQSDTDLLGIDKEKTFTASAIVKPAELLARVVNVLGGLEQQNAAQKDKGVHLFDDEHILANERPPMFSIGKDRIHRTRALSVAVPNYKKEPVPQETYNEYTWTNGESAEKFRKEANLRSGKLSLPSKPEESVVPQNIITRFFFRKPSSSETPTEFIKSSMKSKIVGPQAINENAGGTKPRRGSIFPSFNFGSEEKNEADAYKEKTKKGRHSIFPSFDFSEDNDSGPSGYLERTSRGRHSIFPSFDFSEDEDAAAARSYQKTKRHSIFPTFDFSEDEDARAYKERTKSGRHSIFPTFDFSDPDDDAARYKESTKKGRRSIFPKFDFSGLTSNDEDTVDEEEVQKYQNRTKKGRLSLFPTFGRSKKNDDEVMPESSDELVDYKNKTRAGRSSLFPSFGKQRKDSSPNENSGDLEATIKQFNKQKRQGRNRSFEERSQFSNELEKYKNKTKHGRRSLFDPDVNISNLPESEQVEVLENTSVADLLRALAVLETAAQGPYGNAGEPSGLMDYITDNNPSTSRRSGSGRLDFSIPTPPSRDGLEEAKRRSDDSGPRRRRVSARAAAPQFTPTLATVVAGAELQLPTATASRENRMTMLQQPPPPYSETPTEGEVSKPRIRRYSPAPGEPGRSSTGPVPRLFSRISRRENASNNEESDSRRCSLTDIVVDNFKDKDNT
ncbi:open rectifier K[+] channel 1 [Anticarsia gemmatalis]|uniref:open rectifier K[+] channel 1 n=1 Tax=Anticarsia gemmatalis TaxID=129554 RepID=UPI003F7648F6